MRVFNHKSFSIAVLMSMLAVSVSSASNAQNIHQSILVTLLGKQFSVTSFSTSASNNASPQSAGAARASCGVVNLTKDVDFNSPVLIKYVFTEAHIDSATIKFLENDKLAYQVDLRDVRVGSVSQSDSTTQSSAGIPVESVTLVANQYKYTFFSQSPAGTSASFGWDCAANKQI